MDLTRVATALDGLRRFGDATAVRAAEHLECAVEYAAAKDKRWAERSCYSMRECLESIPVLFGQKRPSHPLGTLARRLTQDINDAIDIGQPSEVIRGLVERFEEDLDAAETARRYRVAQAMMVQAGVGSGTPQLDAFAESWTTTVQNLNRVLHGGAYSEDEALALLEQAADLVAALVGPISSRLEEVDSLAAFEEPTDEGTRRVLELIADERLARYFFSRAKSAGWLRNLEDEGIFASPMQGNWYQGGLLVRATTQDPKLCETIATRFVRDPHRAAPVVVLGVARELGPIGTRLAAQALGANSFADSFAVAHEVELLVQAWAPEGASETFDALVDIALEPRAEGGSRVGARFGEYEFARLVDLFVQETHCKDLRSVGEKLVLKLRRAVTIRNSAGLGLSFWISDVVADGPAERDVASALVAGVIESLRRLRECGEELTIRRQVLGSLDSEILVRIWAVHLEEEEQQLGA